MNPENQVPTPSTQPVPAISPTETVPEQKPWLIIGLTIFVLLLLGTTSYFAYQNYQLKKALLQNSIDRTPNPYQTNPPELQSAFTTLVYFSRPGTTYDEFSLWKLDPSTKETKKLVNVENADYGCDNNFQVDPKRNFIIFCKNFNLYKFTLITNELKQLTEIGNIGDNKYFGASVSPAAISSDGRLLAYEISSQELGLFGPEEKRVGNPNIKYGLYVLNLITGEIDGPLMSYKGAISEVSGEIYFTKSSNKLVVNEAAREKIKVVDIEDFSVTTWSTLNYSNDISFSLDNNCTVIESYESFQEGVPKRLYTTDGNLQKVDQIYETTDFIRFIIPSSNCTKLIYEGGMQDINILDITNQQKQLLMNEDERANGGTIKGWLSDDKTIIYVNHDKGDIFSLDTEAKDIQQLTNFGDINRFAVKVL